MKGVDVCERVCQRLNVNSPPAQLPAELMSLLNVFTASGNNE